MDRPIRHRLRPISVAALLAIAAPCGARAQDQELGWPRQFQYQDYTVVIYQPQLESFDGDHLSGRAAVSARRGEGEPGFGAFWFDATVQTDRDARTVTILDIEVPRVRAPNITEEQAEQIGEILKSEIESWQMVMSLDRLVTGLDLAKHEEAAAASLSTAPPQIIFTTQPSLLVTVAGDPVLHDVEGSDMKQVVNTPFTLVYDPDSQVFYLYAGSGMWFSAVETGSWTLSRLVPAKVSALAPVDSVAAEAAADDSTLAELERLKVIVVTQPTQLIQSDGQPQYESIAGTHLQFVVNTDSDVFFDNETRQYYVVLAGRWYAAATLGGPWTFVSSDSLPADFQKIPPDSERGSVLSYVAGTDQAQDAVLDNSIPQTSAVNRSETLQLSYDGEPRFEAIEGTQMQYAVNTEYQVLAIGGRYYACHQGVWYEAASATGTFAVATSVPDDIQQIPPDNPNYNVRYAYVYDYTPDVVYVGYTPGYTWSYVYGPTVVYGTGYWYRPWISPYRFYPRPVTWGFRVAYNPWHGWTFGFGFSSGPYHFGFARPVYGYHSGWWGPAGYRGGYYHGWNRGYGTGFAAGYYAGQQHQNANIYNRPQNARRNTDAATARAQLSQRQGRTATPRPAAAERPRQPQVASGRNDVFADRDGNTYKQLSDGSWQMRTQNDWQNVDRSQIERGDMGAGRPAQQPATRDLPNQRPETRNRPAEQPAMRPSTNRALTTTDRSGNLNREAQNRQRGTYRTDSYNRARGGGRGRR